MASADRPLAGISTAKPTWEEQIALNPADEPTFQILPPAGELEDRRCWSIDVETLRLDRDLAWHLAQDKAPLPLPEDREGYFGDRHFEYWVSGLETYQITIDLIRKHGGKLGSFLDFGSASGRVVRHMAAASCFKELWAADINWRHIMWMQRYLPKEVKAIHTSSIPHLPIEDNSIDCVQAMSVFSHIETFETAWLAELRRVLKPGGLALLSVVTEEQIGAMTETWPMYEPFRHHPRWNDHFGAELAAAGKIILRWHADKSYSSNVVYDTAYLHNAWGRLFEIVEHRRQFPLFQDLLVLKKPDT